MKITTCSSTMQEMLEVHLSVQRPLFMRYYIDGYEPGGILEKVVSSHKINNLDEIIAFIEQTKQVDQEIQMGLRDIVAALQSNITLCLINVPTSKEWGLVRIQETTLNTKNLMHELVSCPKNTLIIFYYYFGQQGMVADASYFIACGFRNVRRMTRSIDTYSLFMDSSVLRYGVSPSHAKTMLRSFRSVVSKAASYQGQG